MIIGIIILLAVCLYMIALVVSKDPAVIVLGILLAMALTFVLRCIYEIIV